MAKSAKKKKTGNSSVKAEAHKASASISSTTPAATANKVSPFVVAFVAFHVISITIYSLPNPSKPVLLDQVQPSGSDYFLKYNTKVFKAWLPISTYCYVTGFWQFWDMFAPDPAQVDTWCDAQVTYFDGSKKMFQYPHIKELPIPEKFLKERYRKYFERVNDDSQFFYLWTSFGQAIAYKMADDPNNPPVQVDITRHFIYVPRHNVVPDKDPPYTPYTFFRYRVDQSKLYSLKGWKYGLH